MTVRWFSAASAVLLVSACSTATETATVGPVTAQTTTASAGLSGSAGEVGAGLIVGSISTAAPTPPPLDPALMPLVGPWTLARDGDRVCNVSLGPPSVSGDLTARTERCTSVELARIAYWAPAGEGIVLLDFDHRPVVTMAPTAPGAYEGSLAGGTRLTLWR